jgi:hypothetical protein
MHSFGMLKQAVYKEPKDFTGLTCVSDSRLHIARTVVQSCKDNAEVPHSYLI